MKVFGDVLDFLRKEILRDTDDPFLWSDETLCECIAQAHDEFADTVKYIRDSSSIAASFQLQAGVTHYPLHPTVLSVMSAKVDGENQNMVRAGSPALDGYIPPPDTVAWLESINYGVEQDGTPRVFTTDDSVDGVGTAAVVRVWPTPAAADDLKTVQLRVVRLPLIQCSMDTLEERPECPRDHLMTLAHGAASYAYGLHDSDGNDDPRADKQRKLFDAGVKRAMRKMSSKLFAPLGWGFGRAGFTHSR